MFRRTLRENSVYIHTQGHAHIIWRRFHFDRKNGYPKAFGIVLLSNEKTKTTATEKEKVSYMYKFEILQRQQRLAFILIMSLVFNSFHKRRDRRLWCKERSNHLLARTVQYIFKGSDWLENFRMSKETFDYLCNKLRDYIGKKSTDISGGKDSSDTLVFVYRIGIS